MPKLHITSARKTRIPKANTLEPGTFKRRRGRPSTTIAFWIAMSSSNATRSEGAKLADIESSRTVSNNNGSSSSYPLVNAYPRINETLSHESTPYSGTYASLAESAYNGNRPKKLLKYSSTNANKNDSDKWKDNDGVGLSIFKENSYQERVHNYNERRTFQALSAAETGEVERADCSPKQTGYHYAHRQDTRAVTYRDDSFEDIGKPWDNFSYIPNGYSSKLCYDPNDKLQGNEPAYNQSVRADFHQSHQNVWKPNRYTSKRFVNSAYKINDESVTLYPPINLSTSNWNRSLIASNPSASLFTSTYLNSVDSSVNDLKHKESKPHPYYHCRSLQSGDDERVFVASVLPTVTPVHDSQIVEHEINRRNLELPEKYLTYGFDRYENKCTWPQMHREIDNAAEVLDLSDRSARKVSKTTRVNNEIEFSDIKDKYCNSFLSFFNQASDTGSKICNVNAEPFNDIGWNDIYYRHDHCNGTTSTKEVFNKCVNSRMVSIDQIVPLDLSFRTEYEHESENLHLAPISIALPATNASGFTMLSRHTRLGSMPLHRNVPRDECIVVSDTEENENKYA